MARIRKINVSQVEGNNDGVLPAGTIAAYEVNSEYVLRVHDGVTAGGVSLNAGQTPVIFNGTDGIVVDDLNNGIAALFNNGDVYITGGESLRFTGLDNIEGESSAVLRFWNGEGRHSLDNDTTELVTLNVGNDADSGDPTLGFFKIITEKQVGGEKEWKFDADGVLTLPNNSTISDTPGAAQYSSSFSMSAYADNGGFNGYFTASPDTNPYYNPLINTVTVGWFVSGPGLIGVKEITAMLEEAPNNWAITVDLTDGSTWPFTESPYTFYSPDYTILSAGTTLTVNSNEWKFGANASLTLPSGGTIAEGVVTDNPTIELIPANPDVESQRLIIKGGMFEELDNYHLHLTTGALNETSIFLGTDEHNVRTTIEGKIQITTPGENSNVWEFGTDGSLTFPNQSGKINPGVSDGGGLQIEAEYDFEIKVTQFEDDPTIWSFAGNDITFPDGSIQSTAYTGTGTGAITFTGNEIEGNTFGGTGTIYTKTVDVNGDDYSTGGGSIGFLNFGADGEVEQVKAGWTVTFASGETRTVAQDAWQPLGTYWNISFNSAFVWDAGDVMPITFSSPDYVAGTDPQVTLTAGTESWSFDDNGTLTLPAGGDIKDSTGVSQTAQREEGSWTVTAGTNTYSFTVPMDGTYVMWVKCNIPNGIIVWNATASVSNTNVPAIGTQYAWNYTDGGSPILLTAIPNQIKGVAGTISTDATYAGTTSNRFDFTIANTSGASQTVFYGYTKI